MADSTARVPVDGVNSDPETESETGLGLLDAEESDVT